MSTSSLSRIEPTSKNSLHRASTSATLPSISITDSVYETTGAGSAYTGSTAAQLLLVPEPLFQHQYRSRQPPQSGHPIFLLFLEPLRLKVAGLEFPV